MPTLIGKDEGMKRQAKCKSCGNIYEYYPKDITVLWRGTDMGGWPETAHGFKCDCGKDILTGCF